VNDHWQTACDTHPGNRRKTNEDAVLARPELHLWAVADGMGGHTAGDLASHSIASALASLQPRTSLTEMVDQVDDALCAVNLELRNHAQTICRGRTIGSTVVAMLARDHVGVVLWAGDSRLYRLRDGNLVQVTRDHNPIAELLDDGVITAQTAGARETNIVTRAVGGHGQLFLDVAVFDVRAGDTFLLCSDGLYRELEHREIGDLLGAEDVEVCVAQLMAESLARDARDNISVVVSRLGQ
jgi:serine/threonine protein phosphatase PrpC